jgi:hypothetical protein
MFERSKLNRFRSSCSNLSGDLCIELQHTGEVSLNGKGLDLCSTMFMHLQVRFLSSPLSAHEIAPTIAVHFVVFLKMFPAYDPE